MKKILISIYFLLTAFLTKAQVSDSVTLKQINQFIDDNVVSRNVSALDTLFADDFVFSHGSGRVEGKPGWLITVGRANYPLRQHDSVTIELHHDIAIVKGKMNIQKINKDKTDRYWLKYIRVYALRKSKWQLISHSTVQEKHEL